MRTKSPFLVLFLLIVQYAVNAQTINIVRFNNTATYYPGGSISIHINPTGVFTLNNSFFLDLSDASGNFPATPNTIATVNEFFTPLINATIPAGTPTGAGYRLRVRASTAGVTAVTSNPFSIIAAPNPALALPEIILSGVPLAQITCNTTGQNPPYLGWLNQTSGATTTNRTLSIQNPGGNETYTVNLVEISSGVPVVTPLTVTGNQFTFPSGKLTGYYVLEIERKQNGTNESTIRSFIYHYNTGLTNLGNSSSETVCINSSVLFNIDVENIKYNYPGSRYVINYGDGKPSETYTHAQLVANPGLSHIFDAATCSSPNATQNGNAGYFFKVDIKLSNKGINGNCNTYVENGNGTTKWVNSSTPPVANFTVPANRCLGTSITVTNTSINGSYGTGTSCLAEMYTVWKVKKPGQPGFVVVNEGQGKLNYTFPPADVNVAGCWEIRLEVSNIDGCLTVSTMDKIVGVEPTPTPAFKILKGGIEVNTICNGESVTLNNESNLLALQCQNPSYNWIISPNTGFTYIGGTNSSSSSPQVTFNTPGPYNITQSITNSCGTFTLLKTLNVNGAPTVTIPSVSTPICKFSPADTVLDFNLNSIKPTFSSGNFTPSTFLWEVNGSSTPNADWNFSGGTSASSQFPKIQLNTFRVYTIKITVDGGCGNSNATYTFDLRERPKITNTDIEQRICSGGSSQSFALTSSMANTSYTWITSIAPVGSVTGVTPTTSGSTIPGSALTKNTSGAGTVTFAVTGTNNGCSITGDFKVFVHPIPASPTTSPVTLCINQTANALTATALAGHTLSWYTAASGGTGSSTAPTPNTASAGTTTYYVSQVSNTTPNCESNRSALVVTVNPLNTAAAPSANPTLCVSQVLSPAITIATTGATGIGAATGLPTGVTASWNNNTITISGTPTTPGTFNYSIPLTGGCGNISATGTITVNAANTASSPSANPSLCVNTALSTVTITTTGATGIGTVNGLPAGVTASWNNNIISISGTPSVTGTFNYSIQLTGGCSNVSATGTITVVAGNTASTPAARTTCVNAVLSPNILINTGGATGIGAATGLPAGVTASWSNNVITISGTPSATGVFNYSIPLTGGCGTVNATGMITVNEVNTAAPPSATPSVCISAAITPFTIATTGATGIGTATGLPAGVTAAWNNNTITVSGTPTAAGIFNFSIPLTGGCGNITANGTITVLSNTVSSASSNPSVCINTALSADITFTTTGATGIGTPNNLPAGLTATWNNNTITITGTPTAAGTFNYSIPLTGGCGNVNATGTITVIASNTASSAAARTTCVNVALSPNVTITTGGATGIGMPNNLPAGLTATWNNNTITISGTPTATGTFNYSIPLTGGCGNVNATGTITVNATNTAAAPSANPTVCINSALIPVTIATTGATGIGTATGFPAGVTASWNNNTITISGTPTAAGTFNYSIPLTGGCGNVSAGGTITVLTNTVTAASATPSVCINTALSTDITFTTTGATGIGAATNLPAGLTATWNNNTIIISGTPTATGSFNYTIPLTGGCGTVNATGSVTVVASNTATSPAPRTLCVNTVLSPNITITTTGATGIGAPADLPAGVTAAWSNNTITISGTPTVAGTFNYSIPLTGGCGTVHATGTITVNPSNTATAPSDNPTLCINSALVPVTIATTSATGIGTATGLPAGVTATWNNNTVTISGTPSVAGVFNYSIPLTGGCGNVTASGTITVLTNTVTAASATPSICVNTVLSPDITFTTTGATGIGTVTGLPAGLTASWNNQTITISGTPAATGTFNYSIPLTGGCGIVNATGSVTVVATNTAATPSANPTLCINTALTPSVTIATTGATGIGAATGLPAGIVATWNNSIITISGTPVVAGTFNYTIPLTGGCGTVSASGTITVTPANTVAAPSDNPALCINSQLTPITIATTGATGIGAATGLPAGVTAAWNNDMITISGTPTNAGTFNYSIPLTGGCGSVNATGTITVSVNSASSPAPRSVCVNEAMTPDISITTTGATGIGTPNGLPAGITAVWNNNSLVISGTPTVTGTFNYTIPLTGGCGNINASGTITVIASNTVTAPAPQSICINTPLTAMTLATTGATGIGAATGLPTGVIATWNNNAITISGSPSVAGTFNYTIPLTGGCGTVAASGTLTVRPDNTASASSANPTLCIGTTLSPDITFTTTGATGIGTPTNLPAGLTANWNNNVITITGTPTVSGTFNYSIPLTGGCGAINATGTITVTANNTAAVTAPRTICINTALSPAIAIATTGATGIGTAINLPAGLTASWSNNVITISGTATASGTFNYTIPLTGGCGTVHATGTIEVTAANTVAAPSANPTLCINAPLTPITIATTGSNGIGTPTGLPTGVTASFNNNTITISGIPSVAGTFNYSIPLTGGCGSFNATGTITVLINTVTPPSSMPSLCINSAITPDITFTTTLATGIGVATGLPPGVTATWANDAIIINGTPTVAGTFNYSIPLTGGCGVVNATGTIDVKPRPVVQTMTTTICSGQTFTLLPTNGNGNNIPSGTTYTWSAPVTTGGITGVAGTGNNISGTIVNNTNNPQTATYTVTPSATNCPGNDFTVIVTVNPTPRITFSLADQTSCSGSVTQAVTITSPTPGAVIQWSTTFPAGITATPATVSGTTQIPSYTFINSTAAPIAVSFVTTVATPGTPSCPGPGGTYTITVYPTTPPPVTEPLVEYCHNDVPSALTATATPPNTLLWYTPTGQMSTTAPVPATSTVGSFIYFVSQVSPTTPACESVKVPIEVKIKPIPQIAVSAVAPTTCNSNNGVMTITGLFASTTYDLYYVVNNVLVNTTINTNAAGNIIVNNLVGGIYRDIRVILNGCPSNNVAGPFNLVNPDVPATPTASSNSPVCEGATLRLNAVSLSPDVTYEWTGPNGYTSSLQNPQIVNAAVTRTGRYKVVARANGCVSQPDSVDVVVHPNPTVDLGPDLQLLPPSKHVLTPTITNGPISQYAWTPTQNLSCNNCPSPTATVLSSLTYKLTVRNNNGCIGEDDVHITALCEESIVYIPNAFVPNGGANAIFRIKSAGPMTVKNFRIFNRWGELIFERANFPTNDAAYGWDGRIRGTLSNPDVFVYTAEVMCDTGATLFLKGNVTLLR